MKITRELLRQWGACYDDKRISELVPKSGLTPLEVAALDIPVEDRLGVLLREEVIPARDLRLLACDWAEAACVRAGRDDARSIAAIAVARRFAVGEATEAELAAAETAWFAAPFLAAASAEEAAARWSAARAARWSAAARKAAAEHLADVVRVLKRTDEAGEAGKEAKE